MSTNVEPDQAYLCANCGTIAGIPAWVSVRMGDEGAWVPYPECDSDPNLRCPACEYVHTDDDAGPGLYGGTHDDMELQRAALIAEAAEPYGGKWREWWDEVWERRAGAQSLELSCDEKINHWIRRHRDACLSLDAARRELAKQESVMVAADRTHEAYAAMLDGRDLGVLPDWKVQTT